MSTVFQWIVHGIKFICKWLSGVNQLFWSMLGNRFSVIAGVLSAIVAVVWDWVTSLLNHAFAWAEGVLSLPQFPQLVPLASHILRDWLRVDYGFYLFAAYMGIFFLAKTARFAMIPIRAILEII